MTLPGGAAPPAGSLAFDVTTTATFTGPVTLTFNVPTVNDPAAFAQLRVYHGEGAPVQFLDRTVLPPDSPAPNYVARQISARVTSLSPFVIAGVQTTGNPDDNWEVQFAAPGIRNGFVSGVAANGNDVYVGGTFTTVAGVNANNIAKWNGTVWSALGSGLNGAVNDVVVIGTDVYVIGSFTEAGGVSVNNIAKWNGTTWSALGGGITGPGYALAVSGNDLYVGGNFSRAGGVNAKEVAKWNGTSWSALGSGVNESRKLSV